MKSDNQRILFFFIRFSENVGAQETKEWDKQNAKMNFITLYKNKLKSHDKQSAWLQFKNFTANSHAIFVKFAKNLSIRDIKV